MTDGNAHITSNITASIFADYESTLVINDISIISSFTERPSYPSAFLQNFYIIYFQQHSLICIIFIIHLNIACTGGADAGNPHTYLRSRSICNLITFLYYFD